MVEVQEQVVQLLCVQLQKYVERVILITHVQHADVKHINGVMINVKGMLIHVQNQDVDVKHIKHVQAQVFVDIIIILVQMEPIQEVQGHQQEYLHVTQVIMDHIEDGA